MKNFLKIVATFSFLLIIAVTTLNAADWSNEKIYFIMIDRFENGDPSNDVQTKSGIDFGIVNSKYNGGDIQGLIDRLDYIKEMGFTAIWLTPPIANQWWDGWTNYGGYHGYWARDFKKIDEHFGNEELYKKFVEEAHKRDIKVIQDIVTNHTANYFELVDGKYVVNDKLVPGKPVQYPFNNFDYNDPEQRKVNAFHWATEVENPDVYNTAYNELDDINTENPEVIKVLKDSHTYWIDYAGIDGFRIDTAKYVEPEFWREFLNGEEGVFEVAEKNSKENFLVYGEAWIGSNPYENYGEKEIAKYYDYGYNSMLDFPLQTELKRVFKEGKPTSYIGYRLEQRQEIFDPSTLVTFIDNHDMDRFLKNSNINSVKQALGIIYTIPGIPTVYYGTEQSFIETRATMFAEGFQAGGIDHFDTSAPMFKYIKELNELRDNHPTFRNGKIDVLYSDNLGPGPLIYSIKGEKDYLIMINTNSKRKYATGIDLGYEKGTVLEPVYLMNVIDKPITYEGEFNLLLNGSSFGIYEITNATKSIKENEIKAEITNLYEKNSFKENFIITGTASNSKKLKIIIDGKEQAYKEVELNMKENEDWQAAINIADFTPGKHTVFVKAYGKIPIYSNYSDTYEFEVDIPSVEIISVSDPIGDDNGPNGNYTYPKDLTFKRQMDITGAKLSKVGQLLKLTMKMREVTDNWSPSKGFDHVTFQIFIDDPDQEGMKILPNQNAKTPEGMDWNYEIYATGWGITLHNTNDASEERLGEGITPSPTADVNKQLSEITFSIPYSVLNTNDLSGWKFYITTYDYDGIEAVLRPMSPEAQQWSFGGGDENSPKIMDDLIIEIK
jgi:glycosidase